MERKELKQVQLKLNGVVRMPYNDLEEGKFSFKLELDENSENLLIKACEDLEIEEPAINNDLEVRVKTAYEIPVYYNGEDVYNSERKYQEYFVCDGDKVVVICQLKEYEYRRKRGSTLYLKGIKVLEINEDEHKRVEQYQNTSREISLDDFEDIDF